MVDNTGILTGCHLGSTRGLRAFVKLKEGYDGELGSGGGGDLILMPEGDSDCDDGDDDCDAAAADDAEHWNLLVGLAVEVFQCSSFRAKPESRRCSRGSRIGC